MRPAAALPSGLLTQGDPEAFYPCNAGSAGGFRANTVLNEGTYRIPQVIGCRGESIMSTEPIVDFLRSAAAAA